MKWDKSTYRIQDTGIYGKLLLAVGIAGLAASAVGFNADSKQFYHSYLTAYVFWTSVGLGALFFTMVHHLVDATWSVVVRRLSECLMVTLPVMFIFLLPIVGHGIHDLYHWSHADAVAHDVLLQHKAPWLNTGMFIGRSVIYFVCWTVIGAVLYKTSLRQDQKHEEGLLGRMRMVSGPGMVIFALTLTFSAFDWMMSLDPHWYSTIFGVYFFAGSLLSALAFMTLWIVFLQSNQILTDEITVEHFHDLGKLIFAFTVFWTYIAFSQYFLIWYGNIPEETVWYLHRWEGNWKTISLLLVFAHFVIPFAVLLSRVPKRSVRMMTIMSIWMLAVHWIDLYWLISPNLHKHHFHFSWMDAATFVGIGGIFIFCFLKRFAAQPIIPVNDPKLRESIHFVNI